MNPSDQNSLISLNYINILSDGDQDFVVDMLQTFLDNIEEDVERLKACLDKDDNNELREISHKLKGSTQILEAEEVVSLLKSIEISCVDETQVIDKNKEIKKALELIDKMVVEVKSEIQKLS